MCKTAHFYSHRPYIDHLCKAWNELHIARRKLRRPLCDTGVVWVVSCCPSPTQQDISRQELANSPFPAYTPAMSSITVQQKRPYWRARMWTDTGDCTRLGCSHCALEWCGYVARHFCSSCCSAVVADCACIACHAPDIGYLSFFAGMHALALLAGPFTYSWDVLKVALGG